MENNGQKNSLLTLAAYLIQILGGVLLNVAIKLVYGWFGGSEQGRRRLLVIGFLLAVIQIPLGVINVAHYHDSPKLAGVELLVDVVTVGYLVVTLVILGKTT